ncbi:MAG TPA: D-sedoheptulose 7-phosphate isomerase [Alphaproteobacteria bacterium]|nr:D-sedoheptulose 7-phosphate isomerase [Alphaproteobacteria bacterium]
MTSTLTTPPLDLRRFYEKEWNEHQSVAIATYEMLFPAFTEWVETAAFAIQHGRKLLFFGNGGSAGDSQHLATELTVRFKTNRKALPALSLTTDSSALTAIGNDIGFDSIFSRQIEALGEEGDVAIGISTSGKSPNVLQAFKEARNKKLVTVGLTGKSGGDFHGNADIILSVPSDTVSRIQEMHITLGQMFVGALEYRLGLV